MHCVICAKDIIHTPFAVINADDYYGGEAFRVIASELDKLQDAAHATMVAYELQNTVSPFGTVTRGVCIRLRIFPANSPCSSIPERT